ncbi:hypothetical protein [Herbaspirillum sp. ST 5-3]|uniref:hypothetical protein n=1 Tax=Oxalobacteraceae TaxID=75682 RepID=UPI0010A3811F|nr:hypothetical protein [Herbaspirillum sp. ST 5-3]
MRTPILDAPRKFVSLKVDDRFDPVLEKYSKEMYISKSLLVGLLLKMLDDGSIDKEDMKKRLLK